MFQLIYPDGNTDLSVIWPDTLREVGLRDDMSSTHECHLDELRMVDWAHDVLLNQRNAVPHLQQIFFFFFGSGRNTMMVSGRRMRSDYLPHRSWCRCGIKAA